PLGRIARSIAVPTGAALALAAVLLVFGLGSSPAGVLACSLGALVVAGVVADFRRSLAARRELHPDHPFAARLRHVLVRNRRRWGAWMAHAGIALVVVAIAGGAWSSQDGGELRSGDVLRLGSYRLEFVTVERERSGASMRTRAVFHVHRGSENLGTMRAGRDFHPASGEVSNEVAIRHDWLRMHDLFITVDRLTEDGAVRVQAFVNPLVPLLWLAGLLTALGGLVAGWPDRRGVDPGTNPPSGVERANDAVHELRNGAAAPGELLSGVRGETGGTTT
ncbi:MAG: hypothetical protein KDC46_00215, partial [Thermoleophilia bacterium]|nr:hypothetical protein [Thermoleophilia bacterium]